MKLKEIAPEYDSPGTYAAVRFDKKTINQLEKYLKDNKIPNPNDNWHTTLLYSRKPLPNYQPTEKYPAPMVGTAKELEIWPDKKKKNVLVLTYDCPELYQRHHKLMLQHGATYDFDTYKPHITLSYDAGNLDPEKLPAFERDITIIGEYREDLDAD